MKIEDKPVALFKKRESGRGIELSVALGKMEVGQSVVIDNFTNYGAVVAYVGAAMERRFATAVQPDGKRRIGRIA